MRHTPLQRTKKSIEKALYLFPSVVIFAVFMVWPILYNLYLSTMEWNMVSPDKTFVGLMNYLEIFRDAGFLKALGNTALYVVLMIDRKSTRLNSSH